MSAPQELAAIYSLTETTGLLATVSSNSCSWAVDCELLHSAGTFIPEGLVGQVHACLTGSADKSCSVGVNC